MSSHWEQQRDEYQGILETYREALAKLERKLAKLRFEEISLSNPFQQFEIEQNIEETQTAINRTKATIAEYEEKLGSIEAQIKKGPSIFDAFDVSGENVGDGAWDGQEIRLLREALLAVYRQPSALKTFVREELDQNLAAIASNSNLSSIVSELLDHFESEGRLNFLAAAFELENRTNRNPTFLRWREGWLKKKPIAPTVEVGSPQRAPLTKDGQVEAHLLLLVFQAGAGDQVNIRLERICYDLDSKTVDKGSGVQAEEDFACQLAEFPQRLDGWVQKTTDYLRDRYGQNWRLVIDLFLPLDLLAQPLRHWCGAIKGMTQSHPIVYRCSDRWNRRVRYHAEFYQRLRLGRERFVRDMPLDSGKTLKDLSWHYPGRSDSVKLFDASGVRCCGEWLSSDSHALDNWDDLVSEGIPLALWMCEAGADAALNQKTFDWLIEGDHSLFLERVRQERKSPQYYCEIDREDRGYHLGVFDEGSDPVYDPTWVNNGHNPLSAGAA